MGILLDRLFRCVTDERRMMEISTELDKICQAIKHFEVEVLENRSIAVHVNQTDIQQLLEIFSSWKNERKKIVLNPETIDAISNLLEDILRRSAKNDIAKLKTDEPKQCRPEINVEVIDPSPSGGTKEFLPALKNSMKRYNMSLVEYTVQHLNEDENDEKLVLVVCNNHSRLLENIQSTLASVLPVRYRRIILLVVHMKLEKYLPAIPTQAQLKNTDEIKQLRNIVDIAFDKKCGVNGIYECNMNKMVFDVIRGIFDESHFPNILNNEK